MHLTVVILAAGQGTRMRSDLPKVLHPVGGRPMLARVVDAARSLNPQRIGIVHGHGGDQVRARFHDSPLEWVAQERQLGTAHAVAQALPLARPDDLLLVLYGDVPLILPSTLERLVTAMDEADLALLTVHLDDPKGYGRIVRDDRGQVLRIVEEK
ncbi:MAG: NTP transferase domain-containing protein, partial [Ectothiorhodospiraceae bacterium]|nr:NTP transferase domain-containing protein [Ectothiorhodospiraceae bacterium]